MRQKFAKFDLLYFTVHGGKYDNYFSAFVYCWVQQWQNLKNG